MAREPLPSGPSSPRRRAEPRGQKGTRKPKPNRPGSASRPNRSGNRNNVSNRSAEPRPQKGAVPEPGALWWVPGGRYTQMYGNRNSGYEHGYHDGVDIGVPVGTDLAAVTSGTVVYAGNAGADGWRVGIRMPNGKVWYYGHLSKVLVNVGDQVGRGEVIARSGDTGRSSGPHVHFELDRDTNGVGDNPISFLQRWSDGPDPGTHYTGSGGSGNKGGGKKGGSPGDLPGLTGNGLGQGKAPDYGWAEAVWNSNPELKKILRDARANDWDDASIQAAIRGTRWYQEHSAAWRSMWVLKKDSPESYERTVEAKRSEVEALAVSLGVSLSPEQVAKIARETLWLGLTPEEMEIAVGEAFGATGDFSGTAGDIQDDLMRYAAQMGVRVGDNYVQNAVKGILSKKSTFQDVQNHILDLAKSTYASLVPQLDQGMTVEDIASPYMQSLASLWEVNPSTLDLFHPTIRSALTGRDQTGVPTVKPIWKFEEDARKDPRWLQTNNARDSLLSLGNDILKMWGVVG